MYQGLYSCLVKHSRSESSYQFTYLFGHTSQGVPGLEIQGMPLSEGRILKEKIIFLNKKLGVRPTLKRYILCVDLSRENEQRGIKIEHSFLEIGFLLLFWKLANLLPIYQLDHCFCAGKILPMGLFQLLSPSLTLQEEIKKNKLVWIAGKNQGLKEMKYFLCFEDLLFSIKQNET